MRRLGAILMATLAASLAQAKVVTQEIKYKDGDVECIGYLAFDDAAKGKQPGVIVVPEWWGLNDYAKTRARQLAELGYVAFAIDMYGGGKTADNREDAGKLAGQFYQNPALFRSRFKAAFDKLAADERVDAKRIAAIGYCFGGTTVQQAAFSGLPLAGVVSFHGSLVPPQPEDAGLIKARVLILHGADDPLIKPEDLKVFMEAIAKSGADYEFISYGGAVHSFTNPAADKVGIAGVKYDAKTDERSWRRMQVFFNEVFGEKRELRPAK